MTGARRSLFHAALGAAAGVAGIAAARCAGAGCARCFACAVPGAGVLLLALLSRSSRTEARGRAPATGAQAGMAVAARPDGGTKE